MKEYRPAQDDYIITIDLKGKTYRYRLKLFHVEKGITSWHLFTKSQVQELQWDESAKKLTQVLQHGQPPFPSGFMDVLQNEFEHLTD